MIEQPEKKIHFHIEDDGKVFKEEITRTQIANPMPAFKDFAQSAGIFLPLIAPGTYIKSSGDKYVLFKSFKDLKFKTTYTAHKITNPDSKEEELALIPIWHASEGVHRAMTWTAPENYRLVIKLQVKKNGTPGNCRFLMYRKDGTFYHAPTPNVHSDSKLCTGTVRWTSTEGLDGLISSYFESWAENTWNADLLGNNGSSGAYRDILRFSPEGAVLPPIPKDSWETKLNQANGDNIGPEHIADLNEFFAVAHPDPEADISFAGPKYAKEPKKAETAEKNPERVEA